MREKLKLEESNRLYREALELVPGATLGALRPYNFIPKEYPIFFKSGKAGRVTDVDGNEYVDLMATFGAIVIGHRVEEVDDAAIAQIRDNGFCLTLTQPVQHALARKLRELIPSCEKSFMVKSGSDGTHAAIRIARAHTGRNKILRCGYHGWHDWSVEVKAGVPAAVYGDVMEFTYNDLDQVRDLMKLHGNQIAGIIAWPIGTPLGKPVEMPKPGFLEGLRSLADQYGAVLIFDELRTGFRVSLGGAQKGYAVGAVVGNAKVMKVAESKIFVSSTFFHNSFPQVAALKTIEIMERDDILGKLRRMGEEYGRKIAQVVAQSGVNCVFSGAPWMPQFTFHESSDTANMKLRFKFFTNMIRAKVFVSPFHHGFFIYQHTAEDLDHVVTSVAESLDAIRRDQVA
jgi:glutamate-1-semialdehyde aminotransferase